MSKTRSGLISFSVLITFLLIISIAACSTTNELPPTPTQTLVASSGEEQQDIEAILICPPEPTRYRISYFHFQHLNVDPGTGETVELTLQNSKPGEILVWIDESGDITPYEGNDTLPITVAGEARYPDSKKCPVQKLSGIWELDSTLSGKCKDGKIRIEIEHFYVNTDLISSCGDLPNTLNIISGPEQILNFDLVDEIPSQIIDVGEGTIYYVRYSYYFTTDETYLPIEPIVPESD